ncbi:MAG: HEAT repeat domain-containing protein [Herpetosiphon sp.]|nr:HEAT repeat domain-containing protein [Herpetosiphon sp.]
MTFDLDVWRSEIQQRSRRFIRNPQQEVSLYGTERLLHYLASLVLEPFFQAFTVQPIRAVLALSQITTSEGTTFIIHNARNMRYSQQLLWAELDRSAAMRLVIQQLLLQLHIIEDLLQGLSDTHNQWFRTTLIDDIVPYRQRGELEALHQSLNEMPWQTRHAALRGLQKRNGHYTAADLKLLENGLDDRAAIVRAAAARQLGRYRGVFPAHLRDRLFNVALYDRDIGARSAAARALGSLRDQLIDAQSRELLTTALFHDDGFVRSSASIVLAQFGYAMASPSVIDGLLMVLRDNDAYAREAAATALGSMGQVAATPEVLRALRAAVLDSDQYVHDAAMNAVRQLESWVDEKKE